VEPDQQEFYDLRPAALGGTDTDPLTGHPVELRNLSVWAEARHTHAGQPTLATTAQEVKRTQMMNRLADVVATRLQPRPYDTPVTAENVTIPTVAVTHEETSASTDVIEIKFL